MVMFVFVAVWVSFIPQAFAATPFQVKWAEWKAGDGALKMKGYGAGKKKRVHVKDATSGKNIGTTRSEDDGKFEFEKEHLSSVPSALLVESGSQSVTIGFTKATRKRGGKAVLIREAEWKASKNKLVIKGQGPPRATVVIFAAQSGLELGSTRIKSNGTWKKTLKNLASVPCRTRIELDGVVAEMAVKNAPEDCGAVTPSASLTGISISGPSELDENSQAEYSVTASYSDGSTQDVTSLANWDLTETSYAAMDGNRLSALEVPNDLEITLTATYTDGEATRSKAVQITITDVSPLAPVLTGISISGPAEVAENTQANYMATAAYSDGTTRDATTLSQWQVNDSSYAEISGNGLTTFEVPANQQVLLTATYEEDEITRSDTIQVTILDQSIPLEGSHANRFSAYEGTSTCLACHTTEAMAVHASVHYQWKGNASETVGLKSGDAGKLGGINDFCIYPDINWIGKLTNVSGQPVDGGCAKCHVGLGNKPEPTASRSQLENIDCLICHSEVYKRTVAKVDGAYRFVPDTEKMGVTTLQAAVDITLPSNGRCLDCHTKAGGGNNFKRGDLEEAHRNATRSFDVHLASKQNGGAGLSCVDCHTAADHRIAGRGTDLRPWDSPDEISCEKCHGDTPHDDKKLDKHTNRVNCTVCHIPTFAKVAPTDMDRDWSRPGELNEAKGLYEPFNRKKSHVIPEYHFFNGTSYFYQFGDSAIPEENGFITMSAPMGSISEAGARIYAFKHHLGNQPIGKIDSRLLPLKIGMFFETGVIDQAVQKGAEAVGWNYQGYEFARTERFMGLFHEVAPSGEALSCTDCHSGEGRMDFKALGYSPKQTYNGKALCASCHKDESDEWKADERFEKIHKKHVDDKKYDCSKCHIFSKAE
jgi:hypothetical protein